MKRCPYCAEEIQDAATKCKHCGEMLNGKRGVDLSNLNFARSRSDRVLMGVCGGIARQINLDPTLVRVLAVVATIATGGTALVIYIVLGFVLPESD
jgi:phage shock protein PspC (stress-responsive transcriptional regulator)